MGALPANRFECCCQSRPRVEVLQVSQDSQREDGRRPIHVSTKHGCREESSESINSMTLPKAAPAVQHGQQFKFQPPRVEQVEKDPEKTDNGSRQQDCQHVDTMLDRSSQNIVNADSLSMEREVPGNEPTSLPTSPAKRSLRRTHTLVSLASNDDQPDVVLRVGVHSIQGARSDMQDTFFQKISEVGEYISVPKYNSSHSSLGGEKVFAETTSIGSVDHWVDSRHFRGFFGVFDGHGGTDTSKFVETQIFDAFIKHCYEEPGPKTDNEASSALRQAFIETETAVLNLGRAREWMDGSTAAVVAVLEGREGLLLVSGNVGDSEILLGRKNDNGSQDFVVMSELHNMKNDDEYARVLAEGGKICNNRLAHPKFNPRFCSLAVSRTLGDGFFKDAEFTDGKTSGLTAEPYIAHRYLSPRDSFLLLGCDGFFEAVAYLEAVKSIFSMMEVGLDPQTISKAMVEMAQQRGSKDNITVVLVLLMNLITKS